MGSRTALSVACWAAPVLGWVTTSQARYGAQVEGFQNETYGRSTQSVQESLGYLWTMPPGVDDTAGLGGGITWNFDTKICDNLYFREDFWGIDFLSCDDIKVAMDNSFRAWGDNHKFIQFRDVTYECDKLCALNEEECGEDCPLAEVFVTILNTSSTAKAGGPEVPLSLEAANAMPRARFTTSFRYTNGQIPYRKLSTGSILPRTVIETYGGRISFGYDNMCWYLDSSFCSGFHRIKKLASPEVVYAGGVSALFGLWGIAVLSIALHIFFIVRKQLKMKLTIDVDGDGIEFSELLDVARIRWEAFLEVMSFQSVIGTAMRLLLLMVPFNFYTSIFYVCWYCYDFEGAAAHEIGHLLGLGHPDLVPTELLSGYGPTPYISYNSFLVDGNKYNETTCVNHWDYVENGNPADAVVSNVTGVRPSIMESFTQNNPSTCLTIDDLEALNTLYPLCEGMNTVIVCNKVRMWLGTIRAFIFVLGPFVIGLIMSIIIHTFVGEHEKKKRRELQSKIDDMEKKEDKRKKKLFGRNKTPFSKPPKIDPASAGGGGGDGAEGAGSGEADACAPPAITMGGGDGAPQLAQDV